MKKWNVSESLFYRHNYSKSKSVIGAESWCSQVFFFFASSGGPIQSGTAFFWLLSMFQGLFPEDWPDVNFDPIERAWLAQSDPWPNHLIRSWAPSTQLQSHTTNSITMNDDDVQKEMPRANSNKRRNWLTKCLAKMLSNCILDRQQQQLMLANYPSSSSLNLEVLSHVEIAAIRGNVLIELVSSSSSSDPPWGWNYCPRNKAENIGRNCKIAPFWFAQQQ